MGRRGCSVASLLLVALLPSCGAEEPAATDGGVAAPFDQVEPLNRVTSVVAADGGFLAGQLDADGGAAETAWLVDGHWSEPISVPFDAPRSLYLLAAGDQVVAVSQSCRIEEESCEVGTARVEVSSLGVEDGAEWSRPAALTVDSSAALAQAEEFSVEPIGEVDGRVTIVVRGGGPDSVEIWTVDEGTWSSLPAPPAMVRDFCQTADGRLFGLENGFVAAGSLQPDAQPGEQVLQGQYRFATFADSEWTSTPYEPPPHHPALGARLVCSEVSPLAVWPTEVVDGLSLERLAITPIDGYFMTDVVSAPTTTVMRFAQQDVNTVHELAYISGGSIEFHPISGPVNEAAVQSDGSALVVGSYPNQPEAVWRLIPNALPPAG